MVNVFDRLKNGSINLDGRDGPLDTSTPGEDSYTLTLLISPLQVEPGRACQVTFQARKNGAAIPGQLISLASTDENVGSVPDDITTSTNGNALFEIIGTTLGSTTISGSMVIDGTTYNSNAVEITVSQIEAPNDYDATGFGQVVLTIESPLANALTPKLQRLSDAEQQRKYPDDTGLRQLTYYETAEIVFFPKELQ